jgi:hypothetical protein
MQILTVITESISLRADIVGWSMEDTDLYQPGQPIGFTRSPIGWKHPDTVLEALVDGWRLLGPPVKEYSDESGETWGWWFERG